jgi:acetyl esterase
MTACTSSQRRSSRIHILTVVDDRPPTTSRGTVLLLAERAQTGLVLAFERIPKSVKRLVAGPPVTRDGQTLELDMQLLLRIAERRGETPLAELGVAASRERLDESSQLVAGRAIAGVHSEDLVVAGAAGELRARAYVPERGASGAGVVYFHGGGWVTGGLDTHDQPCRALALHSGAKVISVEYRLAPEAPFPAPVDDALAAFADVAARAGELSLDASRLAVAGDSAGGHLAAVTAQQAARAGGPTPAYQVLIYPAVRCGSRTQSRLLFGEGFLLRSDSMDWYEAQFLQGADPDDVRASPLLAERLEELPPALIVTAGFDPLRDEAEEYAVKLEAAGVEVALRRFPGMLHGFINMYGIGPAPRLALAEIGGAIRAALAPR